jgi:hypothetical protein
LLLQKLTCYVAEALPRYIKKIPCCVVFKAADFRGFVNETEIMADVSIDIISMQSESNEITKYVELLEIRYLMLYVTVPLL